MVRKKKPDDAPEDVAQTEAAARSGEREDAGLPSEAGAPEPAAQHEAPAATADEQAAGPEAEADTSPDRQSEERPEADESFARRLEEAGRELTETKDKYLRLAAEYDNFRKRTRAEREALYAGATADTAERFLPVCDNLDRALKQQTQDTAFYRGVEMIRKELLSVFEKLNIRPIEAQGQPFDPALHDAAMHVEDDSGEENIVAEVFQTGFIMAERVIRPSVVKVKN